MTGVYERYMAEYVMAHILRGRRRSGACGGQHAREWLPFDTSLKGKALGVAGSGTSDPRSRKAARSR
jgi:phosphoglycerate dehydrogenase-like enzyme